MNILYICSEYPPFAHGGIGTVTQILAEGMAGLGHKVHVAGVYGDINSDTHDLVSGVLVHRLRCPDGRFKNMKARIKLFAFVKKLIRTECIDIIEAPDYLGPTAFWFGNLPPVIVRLHGTETYFQNELGKTPPRVLRLFEGLCLRKSDVLISVSNYVAKQTKKIFNLEKREIHTIYNSVQVRGLAEQTRRDSQNVIFTGTLMRKKGVFSLIEAWNKVAQEHVTAKLNIYGKDSIDGKGESVQALLEKTLNPLVRHTVTFHGHVDRDLLIDEILHAGIAVFPSLSESLGMAPIETMSTGCPTIFSKKSAGPEIITDNVDGLLVDPNNSDEISNALLKLLKNPELASELGKKGFEKVKKKFNAETIIFQNETFYRQIADMRSR